MNKPYPGLDILCYTKIGQNLMLLCFVKDFAFVEQYKYQITVFAKAYYAKFVSLLICIKIKFMLLIQCFDLNNNNAIFPVSVSFKCPSVFLPVVLMFVLALRQPRYPDLASAACLCCSLFSLQHLLSLASHWPKLLRLAWVIYKSWRLSGQLKVHTGSERQNKFLATFHVFYLVLNFVYIFTINRAMKNTIRRWLHPTLVETHRAKCDCFHQLVGVRSHLIFKIFDGPFYETNLLSHCIYFLN